VDPLLFEIAGSKTRMAFREDGKGKITHLFFDAQQMPFSYEKLDWYEGLTVYWTSFGFFVIVFLSAGIVWPLIHRIRSGRENSSAESRGSRYARLLASVISGLNMVFIIGFAISYGLLNDSFVYGVPPVITDFLVIPLINVVLTVGLVVFSILVWKQGYWHIRLRLYYSLITLTSVGFFFFLNYWYLLGFRF
jgi:hypothetical protein